MVRRWFDNGSTMVRQELTNRSSPTGAHQPELTNQVKSTLRYPQG